MASRLARNTVSPRGGDRRQQPRPSRARGRVGATVPADQDALVAVDEPERRIFGADARHAVLQEALEDRLLVGGAGDERTDPFQALREVEAPGVVDRRADQHGELLERLPVDVGPRAPGASAQDEAAATAVQVGDHLVEPAVVVDRDASAELETGVFGVEELLRLDADLVEAPLQRRRGSDRQVGVGQAAQQLDSLARLGRRAT